MKPIEIESNEAAILAIEEQIAKAVKQYDDAVSTENEELAQMIYLSIQSLRRQKEFRLKLTN